MPTLGQDPAQIAPDRLLVVGEPRNRLVDQDELLGGRQPVGAALGNALPNLRLDAGDPDHEELVKVIGGNRQKPDPLQRGMAGIDRFLEHPAVEMQPGQLAVDEAFGARAIDEPVSAASSFSLITMACADSIRIRSISETSGQAIPAARANHVLSR